MTFSKTILPLKWANSDWLLDTRRVLINPAEKILILSDIHIGYYSSFREQGSYLPMYDTALLEEAVQSLLEDYKGYHWIIAGDIKHNHATFLSEAETRELVSILEHITANNQLTLIIGNHDKGLEEIVANLNLPCTLTKSYTLKEVIIQHNFNQIDQKNNKKYIIGHVHPIISLEHIKGSLVPIFAITDDLLILPAFNYVAGGFDIKKLYNETETRKNFMIYALGKQVYGLGSVENLL